MTTSSSSGTFQLNSSWSFLLKFRLGYSWCNLRLLRTPKMQQLWQVHWGPDQISPILRSCAGLRVTPSVVIVVDGMISRAAGDSYYVGRQAGLRHAWSQGENINRILRKLSVWHLWCTDWCNNREHFNQLYQLNIDMAGSFSQLEVLGGVS